jgi:hypothetical protein
MANIFPRGINWLPVKLTIISTVVTVVLTAGVWYYFTPKYTRVGYQPVQPVPFPHNVHVDQLGMDCRYCHSFVEVAAHSNVPTTQVCMNCHSQVQKDNPKLQPIMDSWRSGKPVEWVQIHKTPDYVYFNHSVHVNRGVSCVECHGKINEMEVVYHAKPHSMKWCLECHREPELHLRPVDEVTNLNWQPQPKEGESIEDAQLRVGTEIKDREHVNPPDKNCFGCHR